MKDKLAHWIAACGPIGHLKFAPGTMGSLLGVLLVFVCQNNPASSIFLLSVVFGIAVWSSRVAADEAGEKDPSWVVIDEVCGVMVSFLFISMSWPRFFVGFLAFRFFDIVKPVPIRYLERLPNGFGIVLDDVMAGLYANILLQLLIRYAYL